jgi:hypothetical protein
MDKLIEALLIALTLPFVIFIVLLLFPEKIEKLSALFWKFFSFFGAVFKGAHKKYLKHDLQGRVNDFVKSVKKNLPDLGNEKLSVEWVEPDTDRKSFIADGKVVLRLRRDDPQDYNFVHGAYYYVSGMLLRKAKRYISPNQKAAIDFFVCIRLFEKEKPAVVSYFLDQYVHPFTYKRQPARQLLEHCQNLDRSGYFFPMFIQELQYLGDKVFGQFKKASVESDVTGFANFLDRLTQRQVGSEGNDLNFEGNYCRLAVMIVGRKMTVAKGSFEPYVKYINQLHSQKIETIYMLAPDYNKPFCKGLYKEIDHQFCVMRTEDFVGRVNIDGESKKAPQHLCVLRNLEASPIQETNEQ